MIKMKRIIKSTILCLLGITLTQCVPTRETKTFYRSVEKEPRETMVSYDLPMVEPAAQTKQMQTKGDITISVEVARFEANRRVNTTERIVPSDDPEFDNYETEKMPIYDIYPDRFRFKIRIKNGQDRILKLSDVALVFVVDGTHVSIEDEHMQEWVSGMVIPGSEKEYEVKGPKLSSLPESCVVGLFLYDIPTKYDAAGNVTRKQNFEWYYQTNLEKKEVSETIDYSYSKRPVYKEKCHSCNGFGYFNKKCSGCDGIGKVRSNKTGKIVSHIYCGGDGKIKKDCGTCTGGVIPRRKSGDPVVDEQWYGYLSLIHI